MTVFFAKQNQTYRQHLEAVYTAWKQTVTAMRPLIERLAGTYDFSYDDFIRASLLTIVLHDIGKMIVPFQEMMATIRAGEQYDTRRNYRHELVSFLYVVSQAQSKQAPFIVLGALAVAGHHRTLNSDLTSFERERMAAARHDPPPQQLQAGIDEAVAVAHELFEREGARIDVRRDGRLQRVNPYEKLRAMIPYVHRYVAGDGGGVERSRVLYALLKGILHYADWHGSGMAPVNYAVTGSTGLVIDQLAARCEAKGRAYTGLKPFQTACGACDGHLIVSAPTGSGKTEAALLWALANSRAMGGAKILYLLPTMVTANSTWQRLVDVFGPENVGLTHSTADLFRRAAERARAEEEEDQWKNRQYYLFDKTFIRPATVATVDQLLTIGFNGRRWDVKEINAANAVAIVDEVHAYDGWTLGLLISAIRHFSRLGTRFLLMSATLPSHTREILQKALPEAAYIADDTLAHERRSTYMVKEMYVNDDRGAITRAVHQGRRVLVVVNTVRQCQELAQQLGELRPICYHSHFIFKDRKRIEADIQRTEEGGAARLVVATQVVEVSLDLDFDWLFTECAPADALVQRAGRVNRYRDPKRDSRVFIYRASPLSERVYAASFYDPISDATLIKATYAAFQAAGPAISEEDLLRIVETVYANDDIEGTEAFIDATDQYALSQDRRAGVFDSRLLEDADEVTRRITYETVSVIPLCFKEAVLRLSPAERREYEVKLPLWYVQKHRYDDEGIIFCDVDYDPMLGAVID